MTVHVEAGDGFGVLWVARIELGSSRLFLPAGPSGWPSCFVVVWLVGCCSINLITQFFSKNFVNDKVV